MFNSKWKLALLLASLFASTTALAGQLTCTGTISQVYVDSAGNVLANWSWRGGVAQVCNLNGTLSSISPTNCSIYYSMLQTAYLNQKQIAVVYDSTTYTCANMPEYESAPAPSYLYLE